MAKSLSHDVHARPDKVPGDHPTCVSCHGGVAHGISTPKRLSPLEKVELCARCHRDEQLMARYGITADTVPAYEATIHGRSVMHLQQDGATCTDCHGLHGVLAVNDPQAPVNPRQTAKICMKCHPGNSKDFAFPYASHFRLSVERSLIYPIEHVLHWLLRIGGVLAVFGVVVLLGLRRRLVTHPRWVEAARAAILMGMITAVTLLLVAWIMRAVAEPKWQIPFVSGWIILAGAALISVIVRFITWSSNRP